MNTVTCSFSRYRRHRKSSAEFYDTRSPKVLTSEPLHSDKSLQVAVIYLHNGIAIKHSATTVMSDGAPRKKAKSSPAFHFLAGLSSGVTSAFLLQPADLLKTRVQQSHASSLRLALREILNGPTPIKSLWRGTTPSVIRTGAGSALYFGMLNQMRTYASHTSAAQTVGRTASALPKLSNTANLVTGALARASAGFILSPVTVIKVRYESSYYQYTSILGAARDIISTNGFKGFFAGFGATAVRDAPYAGLYVLFYEQAKVKLSAYSPGGISGDAGAAGSTSSTLAAPTVSFASGAFAAVSATAITNPFDAIKTRLQLMPERYGNMTRAAKLMLAEEGIGSMFDGLALRMARKAISSALAWTVYEELIRRAEDRLEATAAA
ncbi:Solute carrier family 25 member 38 [Sphaceloma murrayae]|uniref:Mitochondrial glycine transporter n=1 Tax=Sphaceloma murrayae TaxID=2082308 RepID=A0A2K1QXX4_9PEZI|nr:Solute carrier family 25 member 38 [Sphaceloma murrayae]